MIALSDYDPADSDPVRARKAIVGALLQGSLTIFLGAGVSRAASDRFPQWVDLVKYCCRAKKVKFSKTSAASNLYLRQRMDEVRELCTDKEYLSIVQAGLYRGVKYDTGLMKTNLLVALGSLVMGSVRGAATTVVNYNFDDLLEWYLDFHGFKTQVVSACPVLIERADVHVLHPHGFLPLLPKYKKFRTSSVVLDQRSYQKVSVDGQAFWNQKQRDLLGGGVALFVGLSGDDEHIDNLCFDVYENGLKSRRPLGFILMKSDAANRSKRKHHAGRGLVHVYFRDYAALPEMLLSFCRDAARLR